MARSDPQLNFRIPIDLRDKLEASAVAAKRSLTAELIDRLEQSYEATPTDDLRELQREVEEQRELAERFRETADMCDHFRSISTRMLLRAKDLLPPGSQRVALDPLIEESFLEWLNERDSRGAAYSVLRLIDGSQPQHVEAIRRFVQKLERDGVYNESAKKVTLVGNIGRESVEEVPFDQSKKLSNKGPARSQNSKKPKPQ